MQLRRAADHVIHRRRHTESALSRFVNQQGLRAADLVFFGKERRFDDRSGARIPGNRWQLLVRHQLGLDDDVRPSVQGLNIVNNAHDRAMSEGNQTNRRDSYRAPRWRAPLNCSCQRSGAEIEHPIVGKQLAVTNVKGLVIDEQSDELAIGHVNERLTRLRSTVLTLGFRQRTQLIETVEIRSRQSMWLAFVEITAHANV